MLKQFLLVSLVILCGNLYGQFSCGSDEMDALRRQTDPQYSQDQKQLEDFIFNRNSIDRSAQRSGPDQCQQITGTLVIPVVVHVMHLGEPVGVGVNISDALINDAIDGLNDKWRNVSGMGADMGIEFKLADRDPNGNASTGIVRVNASSVPKYLTKGVLNGDTSGADELLVKQLSVWPRDKYVNIWVAYLPGICGFAYLPTTVWYDGIMMNYQCMSYSSNALAHEMGHSFSLRHTFQGYTSSSCPPNSNCATEGDFVCDTPPHKINDCSTTTCASGSNLNNSFKNHMSYCQPTNNFTAGQKDRVWAALYSDIRWSLASSPGNIPASTTLDASLESMDIGAWSNSIDFSEILCRDIKPKVRIKNIGKTTLTTVKINTYVDGSLLNAETFPISLATNDTVSVSLKALVLSHGYRSVKVEIERINGTVDAITRNNIKCLKFYVRNDQAAGFCLNFEGGNPTPNLTVDDDSNLPMVVNSVTGCTRTGTKAFRIGDWGATIPPVETESNHIYLPNVDLRDASAAYLEFDHAFTKSNMNRSMSLYVYGLSSCKDFSDLLANYNIDSLSTGTRDSITEWFPKTCAEWKTKSVSLSRYIGDDNVQLIFTVDFPSSSLPYLSQFQSLFLDNICLVKWYTVTLTRNPTSGGTVSGAGTFKQNSSVTVTATPSSNYTFVNWTKNGVVVSTSASYTFTVTGKTDLVANFAPRNYTITLSSNPTGGGTTTGAGTYAYNTSVTVRATPKAGYTFTNWTENNVQVSTNANYAFTITGNRTLRANFAVSTGVKESTISQISKLFPNPTSGNLQLQINTLKRTDLTINIIDVQGRLLQSRTVKDNSGALDIVFDVADFPKGNYYLNVYDEEGVASTQFSVQ